MSNALYTKTNQVFIDAAVAAAAWILAYGIRFEGAIPPSAVKQMFLLIIPVTLGQIAMNGILGIYKFQWRYVNTGDALRIARSYAVYSAVLTVIVVLLRLIHLPATVPLSILVTAGVLSFVGAISARLARRILYERFEKFPPQSDSRPQRFLIIGAGMHGVLVAREMLMRRGIDVIGFLDDDPAKRKAIIAGKTVLGPISDLSTIVQEEDIDEVLVCIPPHKRPSIHIDHAISKSGFPVRSRIMPTLEEILQTENVISVFPHASESNGNTKDFRAVNRENAQTANEKPHIAVQAYGNGNGSSNGNGANVSPFPLTADISQARSLKSLHGFPRNKSILITGGAGFIGSSLAQQLVDANRVILLDQSFTQGPIQYTTLLRHPNVIRIEGNILETDLCALVRDVDIVVHAAAILGVDRVCGAGRETLETNYVGTSRLLKAFDAAQQLERFVYFSTSEVFGVNSYRVDEASRPSIGPIAESRWSYAMSKLAGEHLVASYFRETHLPITIVRPFNIFGPRRTGDYALGRFIKNALCGKPLQIHGDGTQIRSWCYIDDFCSALIQMRLRPEAIGEDFNIGHPGNILTISELAQKVVDLTRSPSEIIYSPSPFPDISIRVPSLDKSKRLLGYEPKYDLNTGLTLTIKWYRDNFEFVAGPRRASSQVKPEAVMTHNRVA